VGLGKLLNGPGGIKGLSDYRGEELGFSHRKIDKPHPRERDGQSRVMPNGSSWCRFRFGSSKAGELARRKKSANG